MLELIAIIWLGTYIYRMAKAKGLAPWRYVVIMVVLWVGFELAAGFLGVMVTGDRLSAYPFALVGSVIGGYIGYLTVKGAEAQPTEEE